jgi:hypothetical protein
MPGLESECQIERSKVVARWFIIGILAALAQWQRAQGAILMPVATYASIIGGAALVNIFHTLYLFRIQHCPLPYKYISTALDLIFVTVLIYASGFNESPFFYVYFIVLVSNCIRYGLAMSLYIAVLVNVLYAVTLSLAPQQLRPTVLGGEGLKILAFWGVALYGGAVAARIRRQILEIASYEETIAELREELRKRETITSPETTLDHASEGARSHISEEREPKPEPARHLRSLTSESQWIKALAPSGLVLLAAAVVLNFVAPSVLWFLLYPVLILGAMAALATAAAWLLRLLNLLIF